MFISDILGYKPYVEIVQLQKEQLYLLNSAPEVNTI
jgi:hypothetical protein